MTETKTPDPLKGKKYRKPVADLTALLAKKSEELIGRLPGESYFDQEANYDRPAAISETIKEQVASLRKLAEIIEQTGVPIHPIQVSPRFNYGPSDTDGKREYARLQARFVNAVGQQHCPNAKREKFVTDYYWGMKVSLGAAIDYQIAVYNTDTCEMVPVTDENGEPVIEETVVEAREAQVIRTVKMQQKCITLFGDDNT